MFSLFCYFFLLIELPNNFFIFNDFIAMDNISFVYISITTITSFIVYLVFFSNEKTTKDNDISLELNFIRNTIVFVLLLICITNELSLLFFLLEVYSLSAYVLVAQRGKTSIFSSEAGIKYFIIGTVFSLFMIYAISIIYSIFGTTKIFDLYLLVTYNKGFLKILFETDWAIQILIAFVLLLIGIFFKIASAPFHFWSPDVYEASPTTTMMFLSILPKVSLFLVLIKFYPIYILLNLDILFYLSAVCSILVGSLLGLYQKRIKRLLAYSSIANTGFIILGFVGFSVNSLSFATFYLLVYLLTNIAFFSLILSTRIQPTQVTVKNLYNLANLFFIHKSRFAVFAFLLFSSAGLPPFIGFLNKFLVLFSAAGYFFNFILFLALISAPLSVFYYIRILKLMSFNKYDYFLFLTQISLLSSIVISFSFVSLIIMFLWSGHIVSFFNLLFL